MGIYRGLVQVDADIITIIGTISTRWLLLDVLLTEDHVMDSRGARQREITTVRNFRNGFRNGLAVVHPTTDEIISYDNWLDLELMEDDLLQLAYHLKGDKQHPEHHANYPHNMRILYWVEPNSQGRIWNRYPREGLVIECAVVSRLERFVNTGYDEEKLHWPTAKLELMKRQACMQRWSMRYRTPLVYVVGLVSITGWDEECIGYVRSSFDNTHMLPYLVDLSHDLIYSTSTNVARDRDTYLQLFERSLGERKIEQIQQQIRELLLISGAIRLTDLQAHIGSSELISEACGQLVIHNPDLRIITEGDIVIIRSS